jgi:DNA-binding transcriptional regulator LsrR (DeoR family)
VAAKVDESVYRRILQLHALGLTQDVISQRLGIADRTVRVYLKAAKGPNPPFSGAKNAPENTPTSKVED